jgi:hypothetical protein
MLRCFGFRPEGAEQISPGQRPGNGNSRGKQALKGRNKGLAMLRRFRARANALLPLRDEYTRFPLQIRRLLNNVAEFRDAPMRTPDCRLSRSERRLWAGVASTAQHQNAPARGGEPVPRVTRGDPRWRVLILRTFDFAVKEAANKSAQGIALRGVGIAVGVTRRPRGARRGSHDPAGLPDRQVSRAHRSPRFRRCSCLLS